MAPVHLYEPTFRRVFRVFGLTPSKVTAAVALLAAAAYVPLPELLPMWLVIVLPTLAAAAIIGFDGGLTALLAAAATLCLYGLVFDGLDRAAVLIGLGGALAAIAVAYHRIGRDHAFDNFDRLLTVQAVALCWSALGAWFTRLAISPGALDELRASWAPAVPVALLGTVAFGIAISIVVIVGDLRRTIWLRRLCSGSLAGYAVKNPAKYVEEDESAELPALMGGTAPDAVLVVRQSLPSLPFRSGQRETAVARVPTDPRRLVRRVWVRLAAVGLAAVLQIVLAVGAVLPSPAPIERPHHEFLP